MVRLEVIEMSEPGCEAMDLLKSYAAVSDEGQSYLLLMALKRAFSMVQRYADKALLPGRFRVSADEHRGVVNVYMGGKVVGVTDAHGSAVPFTQAGSQVQVATGGMVQVEFTTEVNAFDYERLLPVVLRYATALYDGEDMTVLNKIMREAL